jgi:Zn-dependent peptidase ImmA (M78 family)
MKWVIDKTGRFGWRPFYESAELDAECEQIVTDFLIQKYGAIRFPLTTDDLSVMLERDTSDLDLFADLSLDGEDVEGTTDFFPHKKPVVKIAQELSLDSARYLRLRTTLAHEYGHVRFHNFLWGMSAAPKPTVNMMKKISSQRAAMSRLRRKLNPQPPTDNEQTGIPKLLTAQRTFKCTRGLILQAPVEDWMEWQAGYIGGALLMPLSSVHHLVKNTVPGWNDRDGILSDSAPACEIITHVSQTFDVSPDAAQVRLEKIGVLQQ